MFSPLIFTANRWLKSRSLAESYKYCFSSTKEMVFQTSGLAGGNTQEQLKNFFYTLRRYDRVHEEVGVVFGHVLDNAGVFKWDEAGRAAQQRFIDSL